MHAVLHACMEPPRAPRIIRPMSHRRHLVQQRQQHQLAACALPHKVDCLWVPAPLLYLARGPRDPAVDVLSHFERRALRAVPVVERADQHAGVAQALGEHGAGGWGVVGWGESVGFWDIVGWGESVGCEDSRRWVSGPIRAACTDMQMQYTHEAQRRLTPRPCSRSSKRPLQGSVQDAWCEGNREVCRGGRQHATLPTKRATPGSSTRAKPLPFETSSPVTKMTTGTRGAPGPPACFGMYRSRNCLGCVVVDEQPGVRSVSTSKRGEARFDQDSSNAQAEGSDQCHPHDRPCGRKARRA